MTQAIKRAKVEGLSEGGSEGQTALNHHKACNKVDCISCAIKYSSNRNIEDGSHYTAQSDNIRMELTEVKGKLQKISKELDHERSVYETNKVINETQLSGAKEMLKKQREEIKIYFDKLESEIETKFITITENNVKRQNMVEKFQKQLKASLQKSDQQTSATMEKIVEDLKDLEDTLEKLKQENRVDHFKYEPSKQIKEMMLAIKELGTLLLDGPTDRTDGISTQIVENQNSTNGVQTHTKRETSIKARTKTDEKPCTITGVCCLSDGFIVVVDCGNSLIKMIDTFNNKTVSSVAVESDPHDVTMVTDNIVAVTLFFKRKIQFFTVSQSRELSLLNFLETSTPCYGIIYSQDKITVTHKDKLEVINMKGENLKSFTTDSEGNQLFSHAKYLTQSPDHGTIYVSDYNNNTVKSLTTDGKVKAVYKNAELQMPFGLTVDKSGHVYVCGYNSNNIHRISGDLSKGQVILDASNGIVNPQCVDYNSQKNTLYVGMWCNDTIRIYQL